MPTWMYTESELESFASDAGMKMISWLYRAGYLTSEQFDELAAARPVFLYRKVRWYTRLWKKLWPGVEEDHHHLVVVQLPKFVVEEE